MSNVKISAIKSSAKEKGLLNVGKVKLDNLDIEIEVKGYININDKHEIIETVVSGSFNIDEETGEIKYNHLMKDMIERFLIVKKYTNLESKGVIDIDTYDLWNSLGIVDVVLANIPDSELEMIEDCIQHSIEDKYRLIESSQTVGGVLKGLIKKVEGIIPPEAIEQLKQIGELSLKEKALKGNVNNDVFSDNNAINTEELNEEANIEVNAEIVAE